MPEPNRPAQTDLDRMSHAEKDALILSLFDVLEGFGRRLKELEGKVEKTSQNSSKPPSSDGLKKEAAKPRKKGKGRSAACPVTRVRRGRWRTTPTGSKNCGPGGSATAASAWTGWRQGLGSGGSKSRCPNPRRRSPNTGRRTLTARAGAPTRASSRLRSRRT